MIIECPACATRYEVPDAALGSGGRKVRCAKCRHSWYAVAVESHELEPTSAGAFSESSPEPEDAPQVSSAPAETSEDAPSQEAVDTLDGAATNPTEPAAPAGALAEEPPARRRGLWAWAAIILAAMLAAAALAVTFWGLPEWVPGRSPTFAAAAPAELVLDFPRDQQGWRQLPNGTEIFGASGTITNAGETTRPVPPILIVLRDSRERIVYSWEVVPPRRSLAPGARVAVNEAVTDAPRSAHFADIGWKPG